MKKLVSFALALIVFTGFAAPLAAQGATPFTGTWNGTFTRLGADGKPTGNPSDVTFVLTQKGTTITGTGGPQGQAGWPVEKGVVAAGKATFQVQQPNGPLFKFAVSVAKGKMTGDLTVVGQDGAIRGTAKVDTAKAAPAAKK